jgi:hypothetical protein
MGEQYYIFIIGIKCEYTVKFNLIKTERNEGVL